VGSEMCIRDRDSVGGTVICDAKIHRFPDVREFYEVIAVDFVCLELDPLAVHAEGLACGYGGKLLDGGAGGAAQGQAGENTNSHKYRFSFSAHDVLSLPF